MGSVGLMMKLRRALLPFTLLALVVVGCSTAASDGEAVDVSSSPSASIVPMSAPIPTAADLPARADDVILIRIAAFPEGPVLEVTRTDDAGDLFALLPDQLPVPLEQPPDCTFGNVTSMELQDGGRVDYGPCRRPDAIDALREAAITTDSVGG
jgi:hypothetical protein